MNALVFVIWFSGFMGALATIGLGSTVKEKEPIAACVCLLGLLVVIALPVYLTFAFTFARNH